MAVGQNPQPLPPVGGANVGCGQSRPLRIEPEVGEILQNDVQSSLDQWWNVLEEGDGGSNLLDDAGHVGPQPSIVVESLALPSLGERLAGEAGSEEIHSVAPRSAVEGCEVVPDRSWTQDLFFHPRHEDGRSEGVPLDIAHSAIPVAEGEPYSKFEGSDPCAEREAMDGT